MKISTCCISNRGTVREMNQDNFYIGGYYPKSDELQAVLNNDFERLHECNTDEALVFAVFDGMGGMKAGEIASEMAANELQSHFNDEKNINIKSVEKLIESVQLYTKSTSEDIYKKAESSVEFKGMGTTFAGIAFLKDKAVAMNAGDSRVYYLDKDNVLEQLTIDHTIAARKVRTGYMTPLEARTSVDKNKLTRFLGLNPANGYMICDVSETIQLNGGERFLLCSDGVYDVLEDTKLKELLINIQDNMACTKRIIELAIEKESSDNVTAMVIQLLNEEQDLQDLDEATFSYDQQDVAEASNDGEINVYKKAGYKVIGVFNELKKCYKNIFGKLGKDFVDMEDNADEHRDEN